LLSQDEELRGVVTELLEADWSPEQITGWLKRHSSDGKAMCISHETIYKSLFIQTRGVLRQELKKQFRTKRMFRHAKSHRVAGRGHITDAISIRERPAQVEDRALPGHWEGDLLIGSSNSGIVELTLFRGRFWT
jgi:IS30 family transposase